MDVTGGCLLYDDIRRYAGRLCYQFRAGNEWNQSTVGPRTANIVQLRLIAAVILVFLKLLGIKLRAYGACRPRTGGTCNSRSLRIRRINGTQRCKQTQA